MVTTTARSAWRIASVAPRSMPAGLSQMTQSNFSRSSSMTRATPSSVSASLSRVCEAGSSEQRLEPLVADQRLGELGVALDDVDEVEDHAPLGAHDEVEVAQADVEIDHDDVLCPPCASAAPSAAVDVVLPTPPLPDVTTRTLAIVLPSPRDPFSSAPPSSIASPSQPGLDRPAADCRVHVVGGLVEAVDRDQLGLELAAEDARRGGCRSSRRSPGRAARRRRGSSRRRSPRRRRRPSR